ncbi:MAG: hypothetical protein ACJ762_20825 [Solirubrobacteraceae bacterium]
MAEEHCSWCGEAVAADDGFRACEPVGERRAVFCRLEHVVPWVIQGAHWSPGSILAEDDDSEALGACVRCGRDLDDRRVLLVRHRGPHRIADAFCGPEHLLEWAKAGGRWAS